MWRVLSSVRWSGGLVAGLFLLASLTSAAEPPADELVAVPFPTSGVCVAVYVEKGAELRKGDAVAAVEPVGAQDRIAASRAVLVAATDAYRAARTNALAVARAFELGAAQAEERDSADAQARVASRALDRARAALRETQNRDRARTLYAPQAGVVAAVHASPGRPAEAGAPAIDLRPAVP